LDAKEAQRETENLKAASVSSEWSGTL
jgi:hypothetical protein